jgi:hypothetical protein
MQNFNTRIPSFETVLSGGSLVIPSYNQLAIIPGISGTVTITNQAGDSIVVSAPIVLGMNMGGFDNWASVTVTATGATAQLIINGDVKISGSSSGGGGGGLIGANNGLSVAGSTAQLGGTLIQNTTVDGTGFEFDITADAVNIDSPVGQLFVRHADGTVTNYLRVNSGQAGLQAIIDATGEGSLLRIGTGSAFITYSDQAANVATAYFNATGFGITTQFSTNFIAYLKNTGLTADQIFEFPDYSYSYATIALNAGQNHIYVYGNSTATNNGISLLDALSVAQSLTPNGSALSNTNRAVVYVMAGVYNLGSSSLNIGQFVDVIAIGNPKDIIITASNSTGVIVISNTNNYVLKNLTITQTGAGSSVYLNASQTDNGNWENIILNSNTPNSNITWAGTYNYITGTVNGILRGNISGTVTNATFLDNSCGGSDASYNVVISGTINNVTAGALSLGGSQNGTATISGTITNCKASANSFGRGSGGCTISGTISNCTITGDGNSFGYSDFGSVVISGTITGCTANSVYGGTFGACFIGSVTISGLIENCIEKGNDSFGIVFNTGGNTVSISGMIRNCRANVTCFGSSDGGSLPTVMVSGTIENCIAVSNALRNTSNTATVLNFRCTSLAPSSTQLGLFDSCTINSGGMTIGSGAILRYSTIYGQITAGGAINAKIYQNSLDQVYNALITNLVATPYNVVDANI